GWGAGGGRGGGGAFGAGTGGGGALSQPPPADEVIQYDQPLSVGESAARSRRWSLASALHPPDARPRRGRVVPDVAAQQEMCRLRSTRIRSRDPQFLVLLAVVGLGFLATTFCYILDRREATH